MLNRRWYRLSFQTIKQVDLVLIDENYAGFELQHNYIYFHPTTIYIFPLIKSYFTRPAINFKEIKKNYKKELFKLFSPKIVIFHHVSYFDLEIEENTKIIVYQHSFLYDFEIKFLNTFKCDYFLTVNKQHKNLLEKKNFWKSNHFWHDFF